MSEGEKTASCCDFSACFFPEITPLAGGLGKFRDVGTFFFCAGRAGFDSPTPLRLNHTRGGRIHGPRTNKRKTNSLTQQGH